MGYNVFMNVAADFFKKESRSPPADGQAAKNPYFYYSGALRF
jgi:hypothetical protein